jgi:hypothetical protein
VCDHRLATQPIDYVNQELAKLAAAEATWLRFMPDCDERFFAEAGREDLDLALMPDLLHPNAKGVFQRAELVPDMQTFEVDAGHAAPSPRR